MSNIGLKAILDGCCHLETLDLRMCLYIDLNGDMGKESEKQIKNLNILYSNDHDYTSVSNEDSNDLEDMNEILLSMSMFEKHAMQKAVPAARKNNLHFGFGLDTRTR
nr:putative F-box/LRR-repeat protein 23 [Tanacetum cinerariifolium]